MTTTTKRCSFTALRKFLLVIPVVGLSLVGTAQAQTLLTWTGTTNTTWTTGSNWSGGAAPANSLLTNTVKFNAASYPNQPNTGTTSIGGIEIGALNTGGSLNIAGTTLTLGDAGSGTTGILMDSGSGVATISISTIDLGQAANNWDNASGSLLTISSAISNATSSNDTITISSSGSGGITFNTGSITNGSGTVALVINTTGTGVTTLGANGVVNTFTGGLTLDQGILTINQVASYAGATAASPLGVGTVTFGNNSSTQTNTLNFSSAAGGPYNNAITLTALDTTTIDNQASSSGGADVILTGNLTGSGNLTVANQNGGAYGVLTLTGSNTYSGTTSTTVGTLVLAGTKTGAGLVSASSTGTDELTGSISAGSISTTGTATFLEIPTGIISGTGSFTQGSSNYSILAGANTYSGGTSVTGGTLIVENGSGLGTGAVSVSAGKTLDYFATSDSQLNLGSTLSITASSTTLGASIGSTTNSAEINVPGVVTTSANSLKVNIYGVNGLASTTNGIYTLVSAANGSTWGTNSIGSVYNNANFTIVGLSSTTNALQLGIVSQTTQPTLYWKGGGITSNTNVWAISNGSTLSNWSTTNGGSVEGLVPGLGTTVIFATNPTYSTVLGANMTIDNLSLQDTTTNAFNLAADGNTLTIAPASSSNGITVAAGVITTNTIAANLALGANQTWSNNSTTSSDLLLISGNISGTGNLTLNNAGTTSKITISGPAPNILNTVNNNGTITNTGSSTGLTIITANIGSNVSEVIENSTNSALILGGSGLLTADTYGGLMVERGTVQSAVNAAVSEFGAGSITLGDGTNDGAAATLLSDSSLTATNPIFTAANSTGTLTIEFNTASNNIYSGNVTLGSNTTLTIESAGAGSGYIRENGNITGTGNLVLDGNTTGSANGTVQLLGGSTVLVNNTGTITNSGTASSSGNVLTTISDTIGTNVTGITESSTVSGLLLSGPNLFNGPITITTGTLYVGGNTTASAGGLLGNGSYSGTINDTGAFYYTDNSKVDQTLSGAISGTGGTLTQLGGLLTLSGSNSYTGATTISAGTLVARNATALGTGAVTVASGAGFEYQATTNAQLSLGSTLGITGTNTILGGSIGSSSNAAEINVAGVVTTSGAVNVEVYGIPSGSISSGTYALISGASGSTYGTDTVYGYGNTNFTVAAAATTTNNTLYVTVTGGLTPITNAYWTGTLTNATNVLAASSGAASNWASTLGGTSTAQGLVPGSGANIYFSTTSNTAETTGLVLGDNMSVNSVTIQDNNGVGISADGYSLTINGTNGITSTTNPTTASTIAAAIILGTNQTWTNNSTVGLTVSGNISGTGNLTLQANSTGSNTLSANSYTGASINNVGTITNSGSGTNTVTINGIVGSNVSSIIENSASSALTMSSGSDNYGALDILQGTVTLSTGSTSLGSSSGVGGIYLGNGSTGNAEVLGAGNGNSYANPIFTVSNSTGTLILSNGNSSTTYTGAITLANGTTLNLTPIGQTLTLAGSSITGGTNSSQANLVVNIDNHTASISNAVNIDGTITTSNGALASTNSGVVFSGVIGANVTGITQGSIGTLTLTGSNTFTGGTTINSGTVQVGNANALQDSIVTINVTNGLTFTTGVDAVTVGGLSGSSNEALTDLGSNPVALTLGNNNSTGMTYSGVLSGSNSSLVKVGSGTQILTGTNTYTGATSIIGGTLDLQGGSLAAGSAVTVSNGGTLGVGSVGGTGTAAGTVTVKSGGTINVNGGGTGTLNTGALTFSGTSGSSSDDLDFSLVTTSNTSLDEISVTGSVTFSTSGGTLITINNLSGATTPIAGDYNLIVSTASISDTNLVLSTNSIDGMSISLGTSSNGDDLQLDITASATAPAVAYWTGATNSSWATTNNFSTTNTSNVPATAVPGSATDVVFGTSSPTPTNLNTTLDAPTTINSLTFATSSNVSIAPGASATNTLTLEAATTTGSNGINVAPNGIKVNSGAGTVAISASVVLGTNQTWTNSSANSLTVSGNVSGGFGLTTAGSGTIALTTNNNYTGGTTITAGVLAINSVAASGSAQSLGTGSNLTLSGVSSTSNATLDYTGGTATFGQNITVSNGDYGTVENGGSGVLNLSGSISKNGSVLTLSGGKFVVSGVISGTSNNSDLDLNATTVALSNTNSYNGPTSIANGSYLLTAVNNALPTPTNTAVTFGLPTDSGVTNTLDLMGNNETVASLNVGSTNSNVVSQVISSASTVNGSNITISGSPSGTVGTLTVATTTNDTFSGSLGGSGSATNFNLVKSGTGTLVLSGTNTYTGSTTITGGGIDVTGSTLSTAIGVGNGGTLSGTGFVGAITVNSGGILSPGAAPYNLQPKLSASSNNVLTGTSLTVHGGSILSYNLYNATGNTGTALSPAGGTVVNLGLGAFDLAGDVTSGAPVIINLNNTASAGFGTITDGIPNVYNLVEFGSGDTNITLADLTNGDFSITNLSSVLNPANSAYLTLTNLGDGQEALQLDVVPEPGTWALFGLGLGLLVVWQRRKSKQA